MAVRRGFGEKTINTRDALSSGPQTFWLPSGTETSLVLLDDTPAEVVRHVMYLKGDKRANGMRCTCFGMDPEQSPDPVPRECRVCNAMLRLDRIARRHLLHLTVIDERQFQYEGKTFKDMKRVLELGPDQADLFMRRKKAQGSLVGSRWKVYRSKNARSARHGDDWNFLGFVNGAAHGQEPIQNGLMRHFWHSPAIKAIRENAAKAYGDRPARTLNHQEAVIELITAFDYDKIMGSYDPKVADAFVAYMEAAVSSGSTARGGGGGDDDGDGPPEAPPGTAPAAPDYATTGAPPAPPAMPTGQAPAAPTSPGFTAPAQYAAPQPTAPPTHYDPGQYQQQGYAAPTYTPPQPQHAQAPAPQMPASPPAPMPSNGGYAAPPFPTAAAPAPAGPNPFPPQGGPALPPPPMPAGFPGAGFNFGAPPAGGFPTQAPRPTAPAPQPAAAAPGTPPEAF